MSTALLTPAEVEARPDHLDALGDVSDTVLAQLLDAAALLEEVGEGDTSRSPAPQNPRASEARTGAATRRAVGAAL